MKCRYKYCKNNNEVNKEDAIKDGTSYYCKECHKEKVIKQEIEEFYLVNMPQATLQILRKVINQLLYQNNRSAEYVLFVLNYIKINNKPLNSPFGIVNYCNNGYILEEFNKKNINKSFKNIKDTITNKIDNNSETKFTYKPSHKKATDII